MSISLLAYPKGTFELWLNNKHHFALDYFFRYATHLGDGLMFLFIFIVLLAYRYYYALLFGVVVIVQLIPVQLTKRFLISDNFRPKRYFQDYPDIDLNFVEGVKVNMVNAMPSGHTATAFAIATFFIFIVRKQIWRYALLFAACIAGFSRIYLHQHFVEDVFVGSLIGLLSVPIVFGIFEKWTPHLKDNSKLQNGLLKKAS